MGRPTNFNDTIVDKSLDYIENFDTKYGDAVPSVVGLCAVLKRARATLYAWADPKHPSYQESFSDILRAINEKQEQVTFNRALTGDYNAAIAKLLLGKHGYSDRVQQDNISTDGSLAPSRIEIVSPKQ